MNFLTFERTEVADGVTTLEAVAATLVDRHADVMAEVQQVLDWAWSHFPDSHGPIDDGMQWHHDLHVTVEAGGWHTVALTLTGTADFVGPLLSAFEDAPG